MIGLIAESMKNELRNLVESFLECDFNGESFDESQIFCLWLQDGAGKRL